VQLGSRLAPSHPYASNPGLAPWAVFFPRFAAKKRPSGSPANQKI
jgi:hypothetical protein